MTSLREPYSKTYTLKPLSAKANAQLRPASPAPTTTILVLLLTSCNNNANSNSNFDNDRFIVLGTFLLRPTINN